MKTGLDCTTEHELAERYAKVIAPVVLQLNTDAAAYSASQSSDLAAAKAALTAQMIVMRSLRASLTRFPFPPASAAAATKLVSAGDALVKLEAEQARSSSLSQLRSFDSRTKAAAAAFVTDLQLVGQELRKPPTASQEP